MHSRIRFSFFRVYSRITFFFFRLYSRSIFSFKRLIFLAVRSLGSSFSFLWSDKSRAIFFVIWCLRKKFSGNVKKFRQYVFMLLSSNIRNKMLLRIIKNSYYFQILVCLKIKACTFKIKVFFWKVIKNYARNDWLNFFFRVIRNDLDLVCQNIFLTFPFQK